MKMILAATSLLAVTFSAACGDTSSTLSTPVEPADPGPPSIRESGLEEHANRLDGDDLRRRPAGSRQESLAGTYVLGHLHEAGYATILDPVPVADLVRSTNIIATPPAGGAPSAVVAVAYDTPAEGASNGGAVAVFLETARALRAASPRHEVQFVALGAEHAEIGGGRLGSRRLVREIHDQDSAPFVVTIGEVRAGEPLTAAGARADDFLASARADEPPVATRAQLPGDDVFARAGLDHLIVRGDRVDVARALLAYLQQPGG